MVNPGCFLCTELLENEEHCNASFRVLGEMMKNLFSIGQHDHGFYAQAATVTTSHTRGHPFRITELTGRTRRMLLCKISLAIGGSLWRQLRVVATNIPRGHFAADGNSLLMRQRSGWLKTMCTCASFSGWCSDHTCGSHNNGTHLLR